MFTTRKDDRLLEWIKKTFKLIDKLDGSDVQLFGPFSIRGQERSVRYTSDGANWEIGTVSDDSRAIYTARRESIVLLADENRDIVPRAAFIRLLITASIKAGINTRANLLDTLELAANREAVQQSIDMNISTDDVVKPFSDSYIRGILSRYQGRRPADHLWYLDDDKTYHLH